MMQKVKHFFGAQDLTVGSPMRGLLQFSIPLLIGNFAQQMYNTVDSMVVGQYIGDNALAAVGASGPVLNLLLVLFMGISTGAGIMVAQFFGARDKENLSRTAGTTITLTFLCGVVMMGVGVFASRPLLGLLDTPAEIMEDSVSYLTIIFLGIVGMAYYNILAGVLRGMGDSTYPLLFLIIATVLNIALDILFVAQFGMGVAGVAWATIIAQGISAVLCVIRLLRMRDVVDLSARRLKIDRRLTGRLCALGLPAGVTQAIFSLSAIVVQRLTNTLGTDVVTAVTAVMRVDGFCMMPNFTFGTAATTFVGQNIGARRMDRVEKGTRDSLKLALIVSCLLTGCILLFGGPLMGMFTKTQRIVDLGVQQMRILAAGYIAFAVTQVLSGVMRGAGETMLPMWISILTTVVIRVPIAYGWAALTRSEAFPNGDPVCLFASLLISWVLGAALTALAFRRGKWRRKALRSFEQFEKHGEVQ